MRYKGYDYENGDGLLLKIERKKIKLKTAISWAFSHERFGVVVCDQVVMALKGQSAGEGVGLAHVPSCLINYFC